MTIKKKKEIYANKHKIQGLYNIALYCMFYPRKI